MSGDIRKSSEEGRQSSVCAMSEEAQRIALFNALTDLRNIVALSESNPIYAAIGCYHKGSKPSKDWCKEARNVYRVLKRVDKLLKEGV